MRILLDTNIALRFAIHSSDNRMFHLIPSLEGAHHNA